MRWIVALISVLLFAAPPGRTIRRFNSIPKIAL